LLVYRGGMLPGKKRNREEAAAEEASTEEVEPGEPEVQIREERETDLRLRAAAAKEEEEETEEVPQVWGWLGWFHVRCKLKRTWLELRLPLLLGWHYAHMVYYYIIHVMGVCRIHTGYDRWFYSHFQWLLADAL